MLSFLCHCPRVFLTSSLHKYNNTRHFSSLSAASAATAKLERAELVDSLLRSYGFNDTQISKLQTLRPRALTLHPHKIILPKFEFLRSIGVSEVDLPKIIAFNPAILETSLQGRLIPSYNFLKSLSLSDEEIITMMKNYWRIFQSDEEKTIGPKVELLKSLGVPQPAISLLLVHYPSVVHLSFVSFKNCVDKALAMGFDPSVGHFVQAIKAFSRFNKQDFQDLMEVYRRWGFSDDEILSVFRSQPLCMDSSEKKITRAMEFLINEMQWQPSAVVRWPTILRYSLEKRIVPRCKVIKLLIAHNLVEESISFGSFISISEQLFLDRYVENWLNVLPGLLGVYRGGNGMVENPPKVET
ncbi:hypothetical protein ACH5RR_020060 [Cinchona calisaya]|uniref:Uncharacterized protein n=1 Tax=Cinchona calisaya TaxID=153742 RepID=A0ABD2ZDD4_9GENT